MKDEKKLNDHSENENNEINENTQVKADKSKPELLTVLDTIDFSGDIQPLEDIVVSEPVQASYEKPEPENIVFEKIKESKKKKSAVKTDFHRFRKNIIVAVIIIAVVVVGAFGGYIAYSKSFENKYPIKSVYKSGNETVIVLENNDKYSIKEVKNIYVSKDGMYMYYSQSTASKTGAFDIRFIDVSKKTSLKKGGYYIDNGVNDDWHVNSDASYVCYGKTQSSVTTYYMYSTSERKAEIITDDLEALYMPKVGDVVYFTRRSGSTYSLHRARYGENSVNVKSGIGYARECDSEKGMEILYTVPTEKGKNVDLYMVKDFEEPKKVCSDVSEVYPQDYVYDGNLYYFVKNESNVNWQDFIIDSYYDEDAVMEKPVQGDFMVEKGFIFKRYVLDSAAYNSAKQKYAEKIARDEVRDSLNEIKLGLSVDEEYTCYVYSNTGTHKLATGVVLDNIISYANSSNPRFIFRKSVIDVDNKINIDYLVQLSDRYSVGYAMDYVRNNVSDSYTVSDDCIYSYFDGNKVNNYVIDGYNLATTKLIFGNSNTFYALDGENLYCNKISKSGIGAKQSIDTQVVDYKVFNGDIYYTKNTSTEENMLYKFSVDEGKTEIISNVYSYFPISSDYVIVLSMNDVNSETMNIGVFDGTAYQIVDTDADLNYFYHNGKVISYIKVQPDSEKGGDIYGYFGNGSSEKIGVDATGIIYVMATKQEG